MKQKTKRSSSPAMYVVEQRFKEERTIEDNIKARVVRQLIRKAREKDREWLNMDLAMDGSGELGGVIYRNHAAFMEYKINAILTAIDLSKDYYEAYLDYVMQIEGHYAKYPGCSDVDYDFLTLGGN